MSKHLVVVSSFLLIGSLADAQQSATPAREARPRAVIEEIVVRAQKREQTLREVPISLSVVDAEFLQEAAIADLRDLSLFVPNVSVSMTSGTYNDVRIRGFGTPLTNKAFEQPVGLVIDGIPYGRLAYFYGPVFDLDRVEVLRGPQGTLFGKNTTAGLFNFVTRKPSDDFTGYIHGQLGELGRRHFEAAIGGPLLAEFVNFRISGLSAERDGFMKNTADRFIAGAHERLGSRDRKAIRAQLGFPSLLGFDLNAAYEKAELESLGVPWEFTDLIAPNQIPFFREYDPNTDLEEGNFVGSLDQREFLRDEIDSLVLNGSYKLGEWGLDFVAGYSSLFEEREDDNDFFAVRMFPITNEDDNEQITTELRLSSPKLPGVLGLGNLFGLALGMTDFTAGFFFSDRRINDSSLGFGGNFALLGQFLATDATGIVPPCPGCEAAEEEFTAFFDQGNLTYAGFSHLTWYLVDRWTLEYGMRFTEESKDARWSARCTLGDPCPGFRATVAEDFSTSRERSEFAFIPKVTLRYDWTESINFYAGWARGFKAGGFNATIFNDNDEAGLSFEPERTTSWEIGSKMTLLDGLARLDLALFRQDVEDLQVFTFRPDLQFEVENAAEARSQGVELDATVLPLDWLTVRGVLGLSDANFVKFPIGTCSADRPNTDGDADDRCDLSGRPLEYTPEWTSTVSGIVSYPLEWDWLDLLTGPGVELLGGLTLEYKDTYYANVTLDPRTRQPSFFRLGGNLGIGNPNSGWSLRVVGENLTNEVIAMHIRDMSVVGKSFVHVVEPPRLLFGEMRWEF